MWGAVQTKTSLSISLFNSVIELSKGLMNVKCALAIRIRVTNVNIAFEVGNIQNSSCCLV